MADTPDSPEKYTSVSRDAESSERSVWWSNALRSEDSASRLTEVRDIGNLFPRHP